MVSVSTEARHVWTLHPIAKLSKTLEVIMILTQWRTDNFRQADNFRHLRWKNTVLKSGFGSLSHMPYWPSNRFSFKRIIPILKYTCFFMWNRTNTTKVRLICYFFSLNSLRTELNDFLNVFAIEMTNYVSHIVSHAATCIILLWTQECLTAMCRRHLRGWR